MKTTFIKIISLDINNKVDPVYGPGDLIRNIDGYVGKETTALTNSTFKYKNFVPLILVLILALSSCSKSIRFNVSSVVPSATGTVKLSKDDNGNRMMTMRVENLVDPSRLTPPRKVYVVWVQTKNDGNKNLGKLVSSEAYFSTERNAKFTSVLAYEPVKFFVTAEDKADLLNPGSVTVLSTNEF
jgi:hypothetical protein